MADVQTEKAFQKQPTIFLNHKAGAGKKVRGRFVRDVGLGFKAPVHAVKGTYVDKKCPFTGDVSIRGRILSGTVTSLKMQRACVLRRDYLHYIKKYNRYEKRHSKISAHLSPCFLDIALGDKVTVGQCRPLSKTIRFNVLKVQKVSVKGSKRFRKF